MTTGEKFLQIKCTVNTRMPLEDRLTPIQGTSVRALKEAPAPRSALLQRRHPIESTYSASLRSAVRSASDVPPRGGPPEFSLSARDGSSDGSCSGGSYLTATSTQRQEYNAGYRNVPLEQTTFYSNVRKAEQADQVRLRESQRASGKRSAEMVVDVLRKRETDPQFCPPPLDFALLNESVKQRREKGTRYSAASCALSDTASTTEYSSTTAAAAACAENSRVFQEQLERVRNFPPRNETTYAKEYHAPIGVLPRELPPHASVQRAALSRHGGGRDLFLGTPKSLPDVVLPLFMGHCPAHERNRSKIFGDGVEVLRPHSKCTINLASSKGVSTASSIRGDRSDASIASTVMGFYSLQAARAPAAEVAAYRSKLIKEAT